MSAPADAAPEFARPVDIRQADGRTITLEAEEGERRALAQRFAIPRIDRLVAEMTADRHGDTVWVTGSVRAAIVQNCAVSGEDLAIAIDEPLQLRFVPERGDGRPNEEIELDAEDCDEIEFDGQNFDLGEAAAQTLALAIDPFVTGPGAEAARRAAGLSDEAASGPFAVLAQLKKT